MSAPDDLDRRVTVTRKRGHEWTPENTYIAKSGKRNCRTCRQERRTARRMAGRGRAA